MKKDEDEQEFEVYHFVTGNPKFLKQLELDKVDKNR